MKIYFYIQTNVGEPKCIMIEEVDDCPKYDASSDNAGDYIDAVDDWEITVLNKTIFEKAASYIKGLGCEDLVVMDIKRTALGNCYVLLKALYPYKSKW